MGEGSSRAGPQAEATRTKGEPLCGCGMGSPGLAPLGTPMLTPTSRHQAGGVRSHGDISKGRDRPDVHMSKTRSGAEGVMEGMRARRPL